MTEDVQPRGGGATQVGKSDAPGEVWLAERARLIGLAYRLLGSLAEAEDVVSEAYLRLDRTGVAAVEEPAAWLTAVTTRLALDVLRSARHRRETYVGPWLPEPIVTADDPADDVARAESVTMALLVVLETLSPLERAVFVLREVFAYDHAAIAGMLDRSPEAVRQTAHRARAHVEARRPRFEPDARRREEVGRRFFAACTGGSVPALLEVLTADATLWSDGGGRVSAARRPLHGGERIAVFLTSLFAQATPEYGARLTEVNTAPALVIDHLGEVETVITLDVADGRVTGVRIVRNPEKLARLG